MTLANTTTVSFKATPITKVTDFSFNAGGTSLDNTGLEDFTVIAEAGIPDLECTLTSLTDLTALLAQSGTLIVGGETMTNMGCYNVDVKGATKGQLSYVAHFCTVA